MATEQAKERARQSSFRLAEIQRLLRELQTPVEEVGSPELEEAYKAMVSAAAADRRWFINHLEELGVI